MTDRIDRARATTRAELERKLERVLRRLDVAIKYAVGYRDGTSERYEANGIVRDLNDEEVALRRQLAGL